MGPASNRKGASALSVWTIVVAAGGGSRFGAPKQFAMLGGRRLVQWAVEAARPESEGIVLVLPADRLDQGIGLGADAVVAGGKTRSASVRAGLEAVPDRAEVVVVHDGARPLATSSLFRSVIDAVSGGAEAAVPGLALADTLKSVEKGQVTATVDRHGLMIVQTPQAFRADVLRRAHSQGDESTDDAGMVERCGATVLVVAGDPRNLKVTTPADLEVVQALAER